MLWRVWMHQHPAALEHFLINYYTTYTSAMANLHIFLLSLYFLECWGYPHSIDQDCPSDCLCYSDYLYNLESWKWIEPDVHISQDDPEHERFNPYTDHNEVFENPKLEKRRKSESILMTVTCMIRSNDSDFLVKLFRSIPRHTQVISLIQAPGSGSLTLGRNLFQTLQSLVGLELKGYSDHEDTIKLSGDSFTELSLLTYLNLETVILGQESVENNLHDPSSRILRINHTFNDVETNEVTSELFILKLDINDRNESLLPYYEYKKVAEKEKSQAPLSPTFRVCFTGLPNLQHLKISGCNLHDISWDMFYKLENLKYLLLDENDLLFLPDFVFYATSNLSVLSLSNNKILNLQTVGLAGLLFLQKLDVSRNNITHLSELSLPPFPHLEVADFRHNPITSIFPNTFEIMNSTKTLYLGSPTTSLDLSSNSFYGLVSLTKLDITNVKIRLLEKSMLIGMPQLKSLIMTGDISRISFDAFAEVPNLERLILRNCGIKKISMDAFFGLTSLIELDLSHNSLTFIPPGIFEEQVSLREIFLQHNKLTTLSSSLVDDLPVKILRLEANPWHCSCDLKNWNPQIINRVKKYHIPTPNDTICQKAYDKGSMCFEKYEPKFEVTYSYEKRVSPVCDTPLKLNQRSVFQALRKELKYCTVVENTAGPPDANGTLEGNGKLKVTTFPENYSVNTLKALEKQLLAKPVKPKKSTQEQQTPNTIDLNFTNNDVVQNRVETQPPTIYNNSTQPTSTSLPKSTNNKSSNLNATEVDHELLETQQSHDNSVPSTSVQIPIKSTIVGSGNATSTTNPASSWLPTITTKSKNKEKIRNKGRFFSDNYLNMGFATSNSRLERNNEMPKVSRKSLKLNKPRTYG